MKDVKTKAIAPDLQPAPVKVAAKAKKQAKSEVVPNDTGHPIHAAAAPLDEETVNVPTAKPSKGTKTKGKKTSETGDFEKTSKKGETNTTEGKSTKTALKQAIKGAANVAGDVSTEIETTASSAKDTIDAVVSKGKRKIATVVDDDGESGSKKAKKTLSQSSKGKSVGEKNPPKSSKTSQSVGTSSTKRKAAEDADDSIQIDSSPAAGSSKKQKKSTKRGSSTILDKAESLLNNALDVVTGGQTSILEDVAESAEKAIGSKSKTKKSAVKGTKDAKSALEPTAAEIEAEGGVSLSVASAGKDQEEEENDEWEPEQEIAQLITGFESGSEDEESGDEGFKTGSEVPKLPKQRALTAKERKSKSDGPGVIYVG